MLSELIWELNPLNWNFSTITATVQPELFLLLFLIFAVMLIDLADIDIPILTPRLGASVVVGGFFVIRYFSSGLLVIIISALYILFTIVSDKTTALEDQMYTLSSKPKKRRKKEQSNIAQTPIPVRVIVIFFTACWNLLSILPFNYLFLALEQFETEPNLIITYIGIAFMIFSIISLLGCMNSYSNQAKIDEVNDKKRGYIDSGKFKLTQSPTQVYTLLFFFGAVFSGIVFYVGIIEWFLVLLGYLITRKIMLNKAAGLESHRKILLSSDTEYKKYNMRTAIFNPLFPKTSLLKDKPVKEQKEKNVAAENTEEAGTDKKKDKKKRPEKKERPKKERPKKEAKKDNEK